MRQTSSLHRTSWSPTYFPWSLQVAASHCWELLLPDVILQVFPRMLEPCSRRVVGCFACFFPYNSGLPQEAQWVGFPDSAPQRDFMRDELSRSSLFLTFRPPGLFATPVSPTAAAKSPQGSRDFYTRANHASLPLHASGMLAV